ncbi:MAG TPA: DNA-binding response regulator [Microscillaceae bacterium]|nr:DNA-binding response regulator [Microscillaceae bacterium]
MEDKIKTILADDHHIVLDGLTALINATDDIEVVDVAYNGQHALSLLETHQVDVAVLDIEMPVMDGLKATKEIKAKHKEVKVLILTMYNNERFIKEIIKAGASGYILKNKGGNELVNAIRTIHQGDQYFSKSVTDKLIEDLQKKKRGGVNPKLTTREKEVLKLIVEGNSTREITEKLFIAGTTVETHRRNLIEKLGVKGTKGLIKHAIENNLLEESN